MLTKRTCVPVLGLLCAGLAAAQTGLIRTYAGNGTASFSGDGGAASSAGLSNPYGLALDGSGNLFIADVSNSRIRAVIAASGIITTVAGGGTGGAGGQARAALLAGPCGVALDSAGNIYLTDTCTSASGGGGGTGGGTNYGNGVIWRVDAVTGIITIAAGGGNPNLLGDGGPATSAALNTPGAVTIDASNNIYVADYGNHRIRRIDGSSGIITTVAGNGTAAFAGDGGLATSASINFPAGVTVDGSGNLYIADTSNNRIRRVDALTGIISTVAGTGTAGFNGDGIPAVGSNLSSPFSVALNSSGNLIVSDSGNDRVRMVDMSSGLIWTIAGDGSALGCCGSNGDGSQASEAGLNIPAGLAVAPSGPLFISELHGERVREVMLPSPYANTALTISANSASVPFGTPATLTGTLTAINGLAANATGGMAFFDGTTSQIGSGPLAAGSFTFSTSTLSQGTHTIHAIYPGDSSFAYAVAPPFTLTITAPPVTSAVLTATPNPATANQSITLTATVTPSTAPGGVTFFNGSTSIGQAQLMNGTATAFAMLPAGSYSLTAQYAGGSGYPAATSAPVSLTVRGASTVTVASSANPANTNQSVTFTATVTPASATGSVQFLDGATTLGSATLTNGSAAFSPASLGAGKHSITAAYSGDTNDAPATSPVLTETILNATTIALTSSANPATAGAAVTFTATATPSSASGNVQFLDGTVVLGTVALGSGVASFTTSSLSPGSYSITANYVGDSNDTPAVSSVLTQTVQNAASLTLNSSLNPAPVNTLINLIATVSPVGATGTVQFLDGTAVIGTATVNSGNGIASIATNTLSQGTHSITAVYGGDTNDTPATSPVLTQTVKQYAGMTIGGQSPIVTGQTETLTANLTPSSATGTVTFTDGGTLLATVPVANGTASYSTSTLAQGSHTITIAYSGDANFLATSAPDTIIVLGATSITLASSLNPAAPSQNITFTATVTPAAATGSVQFYDGQTLLATVNSTNGVAAYSTAALTQGSHSITANYTGSSTYAASYSSVLSETVLGTTSVALSSSLNPATAGAAVTFTAVVSPSAATGTAQFLDGGAVIGSATLANGSASFSTSSLAAGTHSITASYGGSATYSSSTSSVISEVVLTSTSVSLSSSLNPATAGAAVTFTAVVSPSAATGTVQFLDGGAVIGSATLANGSASFSTSSLAAGTHSITASYGGSATYNPSSSGVLSEVIKGNTSTALSSSLNPATAGAAITFTAMVSPSTATGAVQFLDGSTILGSATLSGGTASFSTSSLAAGMHSITAAYGGGSSYNASTSSPLSETVKANSSVTVSSSQNPAVMGSAVTFTAAVNPATATGTVQFLAGSTVLGSATLSAGSASFTTSSLAQGVQSITASYGGDSLDTAATSAAILETINPAPPTAPSNLAASAVSSSQINLTWTASGTAGATYNVYQSTASGFTPSAANRIASGVTGTAYSASGLNPATTYYFRVTAANAGGESAATNQASATTAGVFACHVTYSVTNQQRKTFSSAISIENTGSLNISSWILTWTWPDNQFVTSSTNAKHSQSGENVTFSNESFNGRINAGATLSGITLNADYSGTNSAPSAFSVNGTACH